MSIPKIFYIDLFSGSGGTTTGIHLTGLDNIRVVACVNHDKNAIESHKANHPECIHFTEDVRDMKVVLALAKLVRNLRKENPGCIIIIWASLECTNYSKAKGGLPRDADSRTLANSLFMYAEHIKPEYFEIENVREFMAWGPLDKSGRPISMKKGRDYLAWVNKLMDFGYDYDKRILNAADFGAYTSRERYFGKFAAAGYPIAWPYPTHARNPVRGELFGSLKKWKPVREVLDLEDEGESIFTRKKPLVEATLKRIYAGLIKFVAGGEDAFLKKYYSGRPAGKVISLNGPSGSIPTAGNHAIVKAIFLSHYYGNGFNTGINEPCPTIRTKDSVNKVSPQFLQNHSFRNTGHDIDSPSPTILASRKHFYLMNPQFQSSGASIDKPCFTLIARMDKRPPSIVQVDIGTRYWLITKDDSLAMKKIKVFMVAYGISDIKMRMLRIPELLRIQGFPENYQLKGTVTEQKKQIGNAVVCEMAEAIARANINGLQLKNFKTA